MLALPALPVLFQLSVRNALMPGRHVPVSGRQMEQGSWYPVYRNKTPRAVITPCTVPSCAIRSVPVILVEDDVRIDIRDIVCVRTCLVSPQQQEEHRFQGQERGR
jgi:hypothetical protein